MTILLHGGIIATAIKKYGMSMLFADQDIERFWDDPISNAPQRIPVNLRKSLYRKLQMLDAAFQLNDLRVPPGNRLEALKGMRAGQYSIRVNDPWRLCFTWENGEAAGVEFCDYHT